MSGLSIDPQPTGQQILDYVNTVSVVSAYANALAQTQLPVLVQTPAWYGDYLAALAVAQSHALVWLNGTLPNLQAIPAAYASFNTLFQQSFAPLATNLEALAANPDDTAAQASVVSLLQQLLAQAQAAQGAAQGVSSALAAFASQLDTDAQTLASMQAAATLAAGADQNAVDRLADVIGRLHRQIDDANELARLQNLGEAGAVVFVLVVAATIAWTGGPLVGALLAVGVTGAMAGIGDSLAAKPEVKDLQEQITRVQKETTAVDAEVAVLQATTAAFGKLVDANGAAQKAMAAIEAFWQGPASELTTMVADLSAASSATAATALVSVQDAAAQWAAVNALSATLTEITWIVNSTPILIPTAASAAPAPPTERQSSAAQAVPA